jgi:hypothetical protein
MQFPMFEALVQGCRRVYQLPRAVVYLDDWLAAQPDSVRALVWRRMGDNAATVPNEQQFDLLPDFHLEGLREIVYPIDIRIECQCRT